MKQKINALGDFLSYSVLAQTLEQRVLLKEWIGLPHKLFTKRLIQGSKDGF
jgi:hypothetical protein